MDKYPGMILLHEIWSLFVRDVITIYFQNIFHVVVISIITNYTLISSRGLLWYCVFATLSGNEVLPSPLLPFVLSLMCNIRVRERSLLCSEEWRLMMWERYAQCIASEIIFGFCSEQLCSVLLSIETRENCKNAVAHRLMETLIPHINNDNDLRLRV